MEINHYLNSSVLSEVHQINKTYDKRSLGFQIEKNNRKLSADNLNTFDAAIIGTPFELKTGNRGTGLAPGEIRKSLYSLSTPNPKLKLIDMGDVREGGNTNSTHYAIRDMVDYLTEAGLVVIVLGGSQEVSIGISRAFYQKKYYSLSTIDPWPDFETLHNLPDQSNFISKIIKEFPDIFNINFLGSQSHYVPAQLISRIRELGYNLIRLGNMRPDITVVEPVLRDTDFLSFDFSAIRHSDSPGFFSPNPNGLTGEEACQISRYAGLSDRLQVFGLFGVNPSYDTMGISAKLAAQMIWYFLDGSLNRKNECPGRHDNRYIEFSVHVEELSAPLIFYQNPETERWWLQVSNPENESFLVSCRSTDYKTASLGEIPDIWWQMTRKYDHLSK